MYSTGEVFHKFVSDIAGEKSTPIPLPGLTTFSKSPVAQPSSNTFEPSGMINANCFSMVF